ncbi:proline-rich nuclear receptor coactivator 2 A [Ctenocephalides felis]|uniref:proline-rich nuclear receptor coactivator 2 A n=1 Tax=Ctenocephalides felis TaxID=7515 RepID=UPI000E6E1C4C|nr:proline-rich nuclear receptor coactivator 2 A [Ctenocephalides felis]
MTNSHSRAGATATATPGRRGAPRNNKSPGQTYFNSFVTPPRGSHCSKTSGDFQPSSAHRLSPGALERFAASKWGEAPAPASLPRPPVHWRLYMSNKGTTDDFSNNLKLLLNVQA